MKSAKPRKLPSKYIPGTRLRCAGFDVVIVQAGESIGGVAHYSVLIKPRRPTPVERRTPQWGWVPAALLDRVIASAV